MELKHSLLTNNYTRIIHEEEPQFGAPHHFQIISMQNASKIGQVDFQEGPIKENGVNGIANEDALIMVLSRLEGFQGTKFKCDENAEAISHIEAALLALRRRTNKRIERKVEGTLKV
jgi:hypothetical protein